MIQWVYGFVFMGAEMVAKKLVDGFVSTKHPSYPCWNQMKQRCLNPKNKDYPNWGGRGIGIDPSWMEFAKFSADIGTRPGPEYSIERLDNEANYGPTNCRWATVKEQCNNRRNTGYWTWGDVTLKISEWVDVLELNHSTLNQRLRKENTLISQTRGRPYYFAGTYKGWRLTAQGPSRHVIGYSTTFEDMDEAFFEYARSKP